MNPLLLAINPKYVDKIVSWRNVNFSKSGSLVKIAGFDQHNMLIDINSIFSSFPNGDVVDRTSSVAAPFNFKVARPWTVPASTKSLDQVMADRVKYYTDQSSRLNLFWSGGIDSTALLSAFLQNCQNLDQLRVIYSPYSLYENQRFFNFLEKNYPTLEKLDISGDVYLDTYFDGINIKGHGGDEFTASLDQSFFDLHGADALFRPWQDFFVQSGANHALIDFCEYYFAKAGRPIETLIEARWWYYAATKSQVFIPRERSLIANQSNSSLDDTSGFFDCDDFEHYMWHNIDCVVGRDNDYRTYKKFLRNYTYQFYPDQEYLQNQSKVSSKQSVFYIDKKTELLDLHWIMKLDNNVDVRTKNLPLLSKKEFDQTYGHSLDHLFNF